ncbi:hypothetical protein [Alteriqipengyuania lutimaris]|uniref:hypothetical protein n=1 Tax=Alteriqipengyuania lutimaris TaxID=1538146 RepID=UPI001CFD15C3|nr:hypothetical protein [Alteriqipengyuania lutimaris]
MTLPPWKPTNDTDREAFTRFIIQALDQQDEWRFNATASDDSTNWAARVAALVAEAEALGVEVRLPERPKKRGPAPRDPSADDFTDLERAALDVPRIRALFVQHWGKRNRQSSPLAEEIAARRWELSRSDTGKLIDQFQRRSQHDD